MPFADNVRVRKPREHACKELDIECRRVSGSLGKVFAAHSSCDWVSASPFFTLLHALKAVKSSLQAAMAAASDPWDKCEQAQKDTMMCCSGPEENSLHVAYRAISYDVICTAISGAEPRSTGLRPR